MLYRYGFGTFVLVIGCVHCAVRRLDDVDNRTQKKGDIDKNDAKSSSSNVIELDALDPRNQAVSSSYSIVETSAGSTGPNRIRYTKAEFEPNGDNTENRPIGGRLKDRKKKMKLLDGDDDRDRSKTKGFPYENDLNKLLPENKEKQPPKVTKRTRNKERKPQQKTSPKSINEIVEKEQPLQEASSSKKTKLNGDLKNSGTYLSGSLGDGFEEGYDKEKHYDKEGGKKFIEAHKAEAGEKAQQGYKKEEGFDKAENEKHGKEEKKAVLSEKEGEKKGHVEQEKVYGEEYKGNQGEKGISVTKKGGHKKGRKKTGFHKVHHKDEYKKDEVFYDESHDGDEHEEHAHEQEKHAKEKGGSAKKALVDSAYHEGHGEKKGVQDKGQTYEEASGHKKEAGEEAHHDKHSEYGKKGGVKEGEKYGHAEGGSSGGGFSDHGFF
ncbi:hypothetical protein PGB90_002143 [Kerria lacca]